MKDFYCQTLRPISEKRQHRFKKEDLRRATIIDQVDAKFIACLIDDHSVGRNEITPSPSTDGRVLILIDQHAADERVRVEGFLTDLCSGYLRNRTGNADHGIQLRKLSPPMPLLLTLHEVRRLRNSSELQDAFRHWGFQFQFREMRRGDESPIDDADSGSDYAQVMVHTIPEVVSDKLLQGDELRDLVKGFLGQLETDMPPTSRMVSMDREGEGDVPWLNALRWCPRELLDLINSKACRGAIMFNDSLSIRQCEDLVRRLSETVFPFQCAHGRPSMVPLTNLGIASTKRKGALNWTKLEDMVFDHTATIPTSGLQNPVGTPR
ncbi:hypothetical protein H0H87_001713 [Tephrocybe sp. NHM501043]|nr:hypothetical protein H0H87_001713 [Tephrocybe sp. NHM501043]